MKIFLLILLFVVVAFIVMKVAFTMKYRQQINMLFSQSPEITGKYYRYEEWKDLPAPVRRYFKYAMKEGQPFISYVRIKHDGLFRTSPGKPYIPIKGEQYFTTDKPGFIWKGTTSMFTAIDQYVADKGRLSVFLFSLLKIADGKGKAYDEGELLRWLAESAWFPTNLLPNQHLNWVHVDEQTAQLLFNYNNMNLKYLVRFNQQGEITEFETNRFMEGQGYQKWIGKLSDYKELNGIRIPTTIEAIYRLTDSDYSYAKFLLKTIEYDHPKKF